MLRTRCRSTARLITALFLVSVFNGAGVAGVRASSQSIDLRSVTYRGVPSIDAVICERSTRSCAVRTIRAPSIGSPSTGIGHTPGHGSGGHSSGGAFTTTRTETSNAEGTITVSESVDWRSGPAKFGELGGGDIIDEMMESRMPVAASVYLGDEGSDFSTVQSFELGNNSIKNFLSEHGSVIGSGASGVLGFFETERSNLERQARAAAEIERSYREGRAINGDYVNRVNRYVQDSTAHLGTASGAVWMHIGSLASQQSFDLDTLSSFQDYLSLSRDPFAARSYVLNETAVGSISKRIRELLAAEKYSTAAKEFEALQYAVGYSGVGKVPSDFKSLQNSDGVLKFENWDRSIPVGPLSDADLKTKFDSEEGQIVRRVANQYQAAWAESHGLTNWSGERKFQYLAGLSYLQHADESFANGGVEGGVSLRISNALLNGSLGFAVGAANGVKDLITSIPELGLALIDYGNAVIDDPSHIEKSVENLVAALPAIRDGIWAAAVNAGEKLASGSAYERGELIGRIGFEVALAYATAGSSAVVKNGVQGAGAVAKASHAYGALSSATASIAKSVVSRAGKLSEDVPAILRMEPTFRIKLATDLVRSPRKTFDAIGGYRRFMRAPGATIEEARNVAEVFLATENADARSFLKAVIASKQDSVNGSKYFNSSADARRIAEAYTDHHNKILPSQDREVKGFVSRLIDTSSVPQKYKERVFDFHDSQVTNAGRAVVGGPEGQFGQSSGFGSTAQAASEVARAEVASYGKNLNDMTQHTKEIKINRVLDLTDERALSKLGLNTEDVTIKRSDARAYEQTNILGHVAFSKGYNGILLPSAATSGSGQVLHVLRMDGK